jgi:flagellar hook-associated protein 2
VIEEDSDTPGGSKIRITDTSGSVADKLRIAGEASGTGVDNLINGSYEQTIEFEPDATLDEVISAINNADAGVRATVINDGSGVNPYRISLVSDFSGQNGRFLVDTGDFDLGLNQIEAGQNARIFYGSSDPAKAILVSSSTNTVDGVIDGVSINLKKTSETPVTLSITTNTDEIEAKITAMVEAFNGVISRIDFQTRYNDETKEKGPLLGDGTLLSLRGRMFDTLRATNDGFTDTYDRLAQVGISVGEGGKMTFDTERFREAYAQDPDAVEQLFTRRDVRPVDTTPDENGAVVTDPDRPIQFDALGVVGQLEQLADAYVSSIGGTLQNRNNALTSQITLQQDRIASIDRTLDVRREILQRQFLAMEQAIAGFQSQSSALGQISLIG